MAMSTVKDDSALAGARWAPAMRALGDERLARMVESGSESAFAAIYGRYAPILHGYCRSLLRDEDEAGDALQNAMLKALQAMRRSGRTGPLRPWLFRIAHNETVTIIRQRTRRPGPLDEGMITSHPPDDAFRRAAAREQLAALLDDMQNLTEYQRGALVMRELGGLTYDEISTALDTTPLAARQAVFVARRRLSEGPAGPRRLRPALLGLIGPAPAGLALAGALGSASAGLGTKVLVSAAAAVSIGLGSVELVNPPDPPSRPDREVAAVKTDRGKSGQSVAVAAETATPAAATAAAPAARPASAPATATKEPADTAATRYVATARAQDEAEPEPSPDAISTPRPEATSQPEVKEPAEDHRGPSQQPEQEHRPAAQQPQPTPQPGPHVQPQPRPEDHHGVSGPSSPSGPGGGGDDHSGPGGGGTGSGHEDGEQEAPDDAVVPVVQ